MKKVLLTVAIVTSFASQATTPNYNTSDAVRDHLISTYNGIKANSWGAAGSTAGANALQDFAGYVNTNLNRGAESTNGIVVNFSLETGISVTFETNVGGFTQDGIDNHVNAIVDGVRTDILGDSTGTAYSTQLTTDADTGLINTVTNGGIAQDRFNNVVASANNVISHLNSADFDATDQGDVDELYTRIGNVVTTGQAELAVVNDAIAGAYATETGTNWASTLNSLTTDSDLSGYGATVGTGSSYRNMDYWAKGQSEQEFDFGGTSLWLPIGSTATVGPRGQWTITHADGTTCMRSQTELSGTTGQQLLDACSV